MRDSEIIDSRPAYDHAGGDRGADRGPAARPDLPRKGSAAGPPLFTVAGLSGHGSIRSISRSTRRDRRARRHRRRGPARVHPRRRRHRPPPRAAKYASRHGDSRRQSRRVPQSRDRLHLRRPPQRRRVPHSDAEREPRARLPRRDLALRRDRPGRRRSSSAKKITENLRIRAASIKSSSSTVRRQPAKGAVRPRDRGAADGAPGRRTDQRRRHRRAQRNLPAPARAADQGMAVLVSSSTDRARGTLRSVLIFARGRIVNELKGAAVTDAAITEANLTATVSRANAVTAKSCAGPDTILSSDHFPALVLAVLTAIIIGGTQALNGYFLSRSASRAYCRSSASSPSCRARSSRPFSLARSIFRSARSPVSAWSLPRSSRLTASTARRLPAARSSSRSRRLRPAAGPADHLAAPAGDRGDDRDLHRPARRLAAAAPHRRRHDRRRHLRRGAVSALARFPPGWR